MVSDQMLSFADVEHRIELFGSQAEEERQLGDIRNELLRQRFISEARADVVQLGFSLSALAFFRLLQDCWDPEP